MIYVLKDLIYLLNANDSNQATLECRRSIIVARDPQSSLWALLIISTKAKGKFRADHCAHTHSPKLGIVEWTISALIGLLPRQAPLANVLADLGDVGLAGVDDDNLLLLVGWGAQAQGKWEGLLVLVLDELKRPRHRIQWCADRGGHAPGTGGGSRSPNGTSRSAVGCPPGGSSCCCRSTSHVPCPLRCPAIPC